MPKNAQPTIYDVAREAGVSIATVSKALNRPEQVGAETRARIHRVVDELGYVPKAHAVSLARKGMGRIAVVAPFTAYPSFLERLTGVLTEAARAGVEVSVFDHESAATASTPVLATMPIRGQVDGLIVMGQRIEPAVEERLLSRAVPVIVVDSESEVFPTVSCDDFAGGKLAAAHLLAAGHRRIAYLVERQLTDYPSQARHRLDGFTSRCAAAEDVELQVVISEPSVAGAMEQARAVLEADPGVTAIAAHYDSMAVGVLKAARDLGLTVPDDVAVMGYDDSPVAEALDLSTIRQPFRESGEVATRMLLAEISHRGQPRLSAVLDLTVAARRSTAAVATDSPA